MVDRAGARPRLRSSLIVAAGVVAVLAGALAVWAVTSLFGSDPPPVANGAPRFVEQAAVAGIDHTYDGEFTFFVGGGVAAFDCDGNGFSDLYFAGGVDPAALYRNESAHAGELRFTQVNDPLVGLSGVVGAYPLNIDGDDHVDLVVLRLGENVMLRGTGDCRFERANELWGIDGGAEWTAGFSATWEAENPLPTLAFGNYLRLDENGANTWECAGNELLRPNASRYAAATPLVPGWCTLSILFSDWDRSGRRDLRMANDRHYYRDGEEQLWRVEPGEPPVLYTDADGWKSMQIWGMGIATFDVTGDHRPEVFLTSQGDNKLQTLDDAATGPSYVDIAIRRGVTAHRPHTGDQVLPSTAWHPEFQDVNNDGFIDLYISKGNVEAMVEYAAEDPSNLLLGQVDGTFQEAAVEAGIANIARSRGAALVDLNLDGLLDLVEVNRREPVTVWRNVGTGDTAEPEPIGNWIAIRLRQDGGNVDAIGSWIEVRLGDRVVEREVTVGGGHAGGQLGWIHFGLGDRGRADVRIHWPDGTTGEWMELDSGTFAIIARGASEPVAWDVGTGEE